MKKFLLAILTIVFLVTIFSSCQALHAHEYGEWITTIPAGCTEYGEEVQTCSCGAKRTTKVAPIYHDYINNICSHCGDDIRNNDVYKYFEIKSFADRLALYLTKTHILDKNENKKIEFLSIEILDYDYYLNYLTKVIYKYVENGYPKMVDKTFVLRLSDDLSGKYYYYEVGDKTESACKNAVGWGHNKYNISYSFLETLNNPTIVSLYDVLANPNSYEGQYIKIKEDLKLLVPDDDLTDSWKHGYDNPYKKEQYITIFKEISGFVSSYNNLTKFEFEGYFRISPDNGIPYLELRNYTVVDN